jgi:hypothetical protein
MLRKSPRTWNYTISPEAPIKDVHRGSSRLSHSAPAPYRTRDRSSCFQLVPRSSWLSVVAGQKVRPHSLHRQTLRLPSGLA